jgi:cell filamentation protein
VTEQADEDTRHEDGFFSPAAIEDVARDIAIVHAEFLLIHPFRDGNGHLARWLADLMALQAGRSAPDYGFTGVSGRLQRRTYLHAVRAGYLADYDLLLRFFTNALTRSVGTRR